MVDNSCKDGARSVSKMKKTEIGVIPEDWEVKSIKDFCQIIVGGDVDLNSFSSVEDNLFQYPIFSNTVSNKGLYGFSLNYKINANSVTVVGRGIGIGTAFSREGKYTPIGRLIVLDLSNTNINNQFLANYINSNLEIYDESGGIPQLTGISLGKYQIPLPPLAEQEAIATALSDADAWIDRLEQLIAKKRSIKQGAMQELLTPPSEELVLSGVEAWDVKKLGEVAEIIIGLTYSPNDVSEYGTLVLRSSNIQNNKLAFNNNVFVNMKLPERVIVKENDLLVCVRNGSKQLIGKCALIDKKTAGQAFGAFMSIIRCDFGEYLYHYFQTNHIQNQIDENLGATINQLTNAVLKSFEIYIPKSLSDQERIATILSDMDAELDALQKQLDKAQQIKQGMMQELLTGRVRLV